MSGTERDLLWAAWRVEEDGTVRVMLVVETEEGPEREEARFGSLEEAAARLGASFRAVVERAVGEGHRRGRWRP